MEQTTSARIFNAANVARIEADVLTAQITAALARAISRQNAELQRAIDAR